MRTTQFLLMVVGCSSVCSPQTAVLHSPALGSFFDVRQSKLVSIQGIPGAAVFGRLVDLDVSIASAAVSADGTIVLALCGDEQKPCLIRPKLTGVQFVSSAMRSPDWILLSPSGRAAVLYASESNQLQVLTGLEGEPVARNIQPPVAPRSKQAVAVSDDGALVLVAGEDQVWLLARDRPDVAIPIAGSIQAVTFQANNRFAAVIGASGEIFSSSDAAGTDFRQISSGSEDLSDPVAIRFTAGGQALLVATTKGTLGLVDFNGSRRTASCQCAPSGMEPMASSGLFLLTNDSSRTAYLAAESDGAPRVWFVPALIPPQAEGSVQ